MNNIKEKKQVVSARVPVYIKNRIRMMAGGLGYSESALVLDILRAYFKKLDLANQAQLKLGFNNISDDEKNEKTSTPGGHRA